MSRLEFRTVASVTIGMNFDFSNVIKRVAGIKNYSTIRGHGSYVATEMHFLHVPIVLTWMSVALAVPVQYYATKYDHIDVEMILNNRRMVNYYSGCLLNKGPCPPEGVEFKRILPEALRTNCERCTEKQKTVTLRAVRRLKKEYPKVWAQLQHEWDPDDIYVKQFEATYGNRDTAIRQSSTTPAIQVLNRFGNDEENTIASASSFTHSSTTNKPSSTIHAISSTIRPVISSTTASTSTTSTTTSKPTTKAFVTKSTFTTQKYFSSSTTLKPSPSTSKVPTAKPVNKIQTTRLSPVPNPGGMNIPIRINIRPIANIGQGIEATVKRVKHIEKTFRNLAKEKLHRFRLFNKLMLG
ncbi:unnamed protein product [Callosobruchus maculatus]|uniref:Chemosensory protein 5 n=1 Tax=Callosobruchus maculatus TaxID=64391 RepID=A0A653CVW9_CALMS|nr:unnamed protein product [Callosobruchus maculatus]